ncbi:hypothetical protein PFISCL1PPCAC_15579, partial [Pristionchus fissidentatus]
SLSLSLKYILFQFEVKLFKFRPIQSFPKNVVEVTMDEFLKEYSTPNWNMTKYMETLMLGSIDMSRGVAVEDSIGLHSIIQILSENRDILPDYIKLSYIHKMPTFFFSKRKFVDFPNPNTTEKVEDCTNLILRFFPIVVQNVYQQSTYPEILEWIEIASAATKRVYYKMIDNSELFESYEKILMLDSVKEMRINPFDDSELKNGSGSLRSIDMNEYFTLGEFMTNDNLLHNLRAFEGSIISQANPLDDSPFTIIGSREIYMQTHLKSIDLEGVLPQIGIPRIIHILGHEFGHHLTDYAIHEKMRDNRVRLSERLTRHLHRVQSCIIKEADRLTALSTLLGGISDPNGRRTSREIISDVLGIIVSLEIYSSLHLDLLPGMKSQEEVFYRAILSSVFFCRPLKQYELIKNFLMSTHPMFSQRIEFNRGFDPSHHFEKAFNCTRETTIKCPTIFEE